MPMSLMKSTSLTDDELRTPECPRLAVVHLAVAKY